MTTDTAQSEVLLRWSDIVVTVGRRGQERLLLAAADLEVRAGETLWIATSDDDTRAALVSLLDGTRRPLYGHRTAMARPAGTAVRLVVTDVPGAGLPGADDIDTPPGTATVVIAALPPEPATGNGPLRCLSVVNGALRPAVPVELGGERS